MTARGRTRLAVLRATGALLESRAAGRQRAGRKRVVRSAPDAECVRILLIRPDHLGDVLLAGPAGHLLRSALPSARIDWLVGPWAAEVARRSGADGDVLTCEFPAFARRPKRAPWSPYATLLETATRLRAHGYDLAVVLRPDHWWGAMLAAVAGIPSRVGFAVPECSPFLTRALPPPLGTHAVASNVALAREALTSLGVGVPPSTADPTFAIADEERAWAEATLGYRGRRSGRLVALHPGSGAAVKNWLPNRWIEVARTLRGTADTELVLTGGPDERPMVERIADGLRPRPLTLAGGTTLGQLAALFARCALVLGGDSGPLHLAAAVGTPTVRLYGPTPRATFGPWGDSALHRSIQATLPCQPCGNLVAPPCGAVATPACLRVVGSDALVGAALDVLEGAGSRAARRPPSSRSGGTWPRC